MYSILIVVFENSLYDNANNYLTSLQEFVSLTCYNFFDFLLCNISLSRNPQENESKLPKKYVRGVAKGICFDGFELLGEKLLFIVI